MDSASPLPGKHLYSFFKFGSLLYFVGIMLGLLLSTNSSLYAAAMPDTPTPCEPCQTSAQDPWVGPLTYITSSAVAGSACTITITYYTRICTFSNTPEIKIASIAPSANCSTLTYTAEEFATLAMAALLRDNPMNFAPTTPGASAVWNVIRPACWMQQPAPPPVPEQPAVPGVITGCSTECCLSQVRAEMFECDENTSLGVSDHGYPTVLVPGTPVPGCICKCTGIFERYRQIMTGNSN